MGRRIITGEVQQTLSIISCQSLKFQGKQQKRSLNICACFILVLILQNGVLKSSNFHFSYYLVLIGLLYPFLKLTHSKIYDKDNFTLDFKREKKMKKEKKMKSYTSFQPSFDYHLQIIYNRLNYFLYAYLWDSNVLTYLSTEIM